MIADLVSVTTEDGMRLHGVLHRASAENASSKACALLCLHGVGSNFYSGALFDGITPRLLKSGVSVLWANTRGHDTVHNTRAGSRPIRQGAAYEIVDECRFDVAAWLLFLAQAGLSRPGILGHSLGAIKAVYSQTFQPYPGTACVIAISPPRLSYSVFRNGTDSAPFFASIAAAEQAVQQGRGGELIDV